MTFTSGQIFVYDNISSHLPVYDDFFSSRSLQMFGTDNIYKLFQYAKEITPEIMIFNLNENPQQTISALKQLTNETSSHYPIIVLNPHNVDFNPDHHIAHYLKAPLDTKKLIDIIESYCIGSKHHQILLLDTITENNPLVQQFNDRKYVYFEVHNADAANRYLQKNYPEIACVEYSVPFIIERHNLNHDRIFYVDRHQDIAEIEQFLH